MKIYLAGKMTGLPHFGFADFYEAAEYLRAQGHEVYSPAERDIETFGEAFAASNVAGDVGQAERDFGFSLRDALADSLLYICEDADAVAVLPNWKSSRGAKAEVATALALGLKVIEL